ncbi:(2Fe-2S)-binding protein [Minwuia sp.]|uniref:(2Fe-2S)-binding protein n=1 Tax=Minwuia sp. TaxID=2493630 RepID=UPI003A957B94
MYVCICNALSDDQVAASIDGGVRDASEVHPHLGCQVRCGRCIPTIVDMMDARVNGDPGAMSVAAE